MTTRTIRETDITIHRAHRQDTSYGARYFLSDGRVRRHYAMNFAEALAFRADMIDERAGAAQVGDLVRIGLKGQVTYRVTSVGEDGTVLLLSKDAAGHHRFRRVEVERLHVVEAKR